MPDVTFPAAALVEAQRRAQAEEATQLEAERAAQLAVQPATPKPPAPPQVFIKVRP
jgi:hypothetical protein